MKKRTYHGAKNSTRIKLSLSTTELKLSGLKSMTSESAATAKVAASRSVEDVNNDDKRIAAYFFRRKGGGGDVEEQDEGIGPD